MKLVPLGDRVVLKQLEAEEKTASGIVLPGQSQEKPQQAEVTLSQNHRVCACRKILDSFMNHCLCKNGCRCGTVACNIVCLRYHNRRI